MAVNLSPNEQRIYDYLKSISPSWATNSEIGEGTRVQPHQQVFQITRRLMQEGLINGVQGREQGRAWVFACQLDSSKPEVHMPTEHLSSTPPVGNQEISMTPAQFEILAQQAMSRHFGQALFPNSLPGVPKKFDLVSADGSVVGDAKYFTLVQRTNLPPAKFSVIAEHVWLLEKTQARCRFLVFGNQREVPMLWLKRYGHLVNSVEFYFLSQDGTLERLL